MNEAKEQKWWAGRRDTAYQAVLTGERYISIAEHLGISWRTLWKWRRHPYWVARVGTERAQRQGAHEEQMLAAEAAAVSALPEHVARNAAIALEYLHRRGVLPKPMEEGEAAARTLLIRYGPRPDVAGPDREGRHGSREDTP
jgi:hypothetical protein